MAINGRQAVGQIGVTLILRDIAAAADVDRDSAGELPRRFAAERAACRREQGLG